MLDIFICTGLCGLVPQTDLVNLDDESLVILVDAGRLIVTTKLLDTRDGHPGWLISWLLL